MERVERFIYTISEIDPGKAFVFGLILMMVMGVFTGCVVAIINTIASVSCP